MCLNKQSFEFLSRNEIEWTDIRPFAGDSKPVYHVMTKTEDYILKCAQRGGVQPSMRSKLFPSLGFEQEISVYRTFHQHYTDLVFFVPRLIAADNQNLLIEMIADGSSIPCEQSLELKEQIAAAVYGLTTGVQQERRSWFRAKLHYWTYSAEANILRTGLRLIRRRMGLMAEWSAVVLLLKSRSLQSPLRRSYWSHNDFSANNSILEPNRKNVYIIDFQDVTAERRWLLYDITRYCFRAPESAGTETYDGLIDADLVASYLSHFGEDLRSSVHLPTQIRFALLIDAVRSLSWRTTTSNGESCPPLCTMLQNLVLSDCGYADWYARFFVQLQQSLARLGCHEWLTTEGRFTAEAALAESAV